ncbi:MAG: TonB-dependent receptor, partial [Planctomycetes bacterium]|nr:TonB-dependent receptor [Planctomycetota bacterium]
RGLHDVYSDRTLALVDGRSAESPMYGGSQWDHVPLFMDDIERIEIVRGPGGAAWGANAFNGVINVITKDPEHTQGVRAMTQVNSFGDTYTHLRWGATYGSWAWRVSIGYEERKSTEDILGPQPTQVIAGQTLGFANDYSRDGKIAADGSYRFDDVTRLTFGAAYGRRRHGAYEFVAYQPRDEAEIDSVRSYLKLERELESGAQASVQWTGNVERIDEPSITKFDTLENALDLQVDLPEAAGHQVSIGATGKLVSIDQEPYRPEHATFGDVDGINEESVGVFAIDRWRATDPLTIEAQGRGDYYSGTHADWAGRLAFIYALDPDQHHILRLAGARAYRTPLIGLREPSVSRSVDIGAPFGVIPIYQVAPSDDLENEETWSLEAGASTMPVDEVLVRIDAYYQRYANLISFVPETVSTGLPPFPGLPQTFPRYRPENGEGATAHGIETEVVWTLPRVRLNAWYAYNEFEADDTDRGTDQSVRAYLPAPHKVGAGFRWFIAPEVAVNVNYRWTAETPPDPSTNRSSSSAEIPETHRLDGSLSWPFTRHGRIMVGVDDLLDQTDIAVASLASFAAHRTPGRSFYLRGEVEF